MADPDVEFVYITDTAPVPHEHDTAEEFRDPLLNIHHDEVAYDYLLQPSGIDKLDILWVIDTSCSMNDDQAQVVDGINSMRAALPESLDWRLVMISTDSYEAEVHEYSQFPGYLDPFSANADVLTMYSEIEGYGEAGHESIYMYTEYNPHALEWMRADAAILVVIVSDEDDTSRRYVTTPGTFVVWYEDFRDDVYYAAIVRTDRYDIGYDYITAAGMLGGTVINFETPSWTAGVDAAAQQVITYDRIALSEVPDPASIELYYDDVEQSGWTYDPTENSVILPDTPSGGTQILVVYVVA